MATRERIDDALRQVALAVSSARGDEVFAQLARYIATALQTDCAMIAELTDPEQQSVTTRAVCDRGHTVANFTYTLHGTPCENVIGQRYRCIAREAARQFPNDGLLSQHGYDSYAGYPLFDTRGQALGLIAVLHRQPLTDPALTESLLKIVAVRAAAELERQRADAAQRVLEQSYREIFEASEDGIFIHDVETGVILDVNPKACAACGYTCEELRGLDVGAISSGEHAYTLADANHYFARAKAGETVRFEWQRRNRDGSLHWDDVMLKQVTLAGQARILAFTREITARKQLEAQLRQAQKMEALGHLTGGIAHDFNNILTSILGYAAMALERATDHGDTRQTRYLSQIQSAGERARDLIKQMLVFSRGGRGSPRPLQLPTLLREAVRLFGATFPATVEFRSELDERTPPVLLDPVQVEQVLMNLCINARDAMQGQGVLELRVGSVTVSDGVCASCRQSVQGEFVELSVADSGSGIAPAVLERMFEPFFTTKEVSKGSGMGLATTHGIVHEHGGHILVETAVGAGARFRVLFPPTLEAAAVPSPVPLETAARARWQGRVLLVDDETAVAEFMHDLLQSRGLTVTVAAQGLAALELYRHHPDDFDLVITDQTMPKMTGIVLAKELKTLRPELPVILYTGHSEELTPARIEAAGVTGFLRKPVVIDDLFKLIDRLLPRRVL